MAVAGEEFRKVWTADFYNQIVAAIGGGISGGGKITTSGPLGLTKNAHGIQLSAPPIFQQLSTIQGYIVGGTAPAVTNGTEIVDAYAWLGYSIQAAYFKLVAGTCTVSVLVNGSAISWLSGISVTTTANAIWIPVPAPNASHGVGPGARLEIQVTSAASATGLAFSLYTPF